MKPASTQSASNRKPGEIEVALPRSDPFERRRAAPTESDRAEPSASSSVQPSRPQYRVHANDTLRSIARDTLGSSRRADEILDLNRDVIDDPNQLIPGQILELPVDARIASGTDRRDRDR